MAAVAEEVSAQERAVTHTWERRIHGLDKSALEHKLNDWGNWIEARLDHEGYPQSDAVAAALEGAGGGQAGHRILCLIMPDRLWSVHQRILRLPEHEHEAIIVWYVPALHGDPPRQYSVYKAELDAGRERTLSLNRITNRQESRVANEGWDQWIIHERGGSRVCADEIFYTEEQAETRRAQLHREQLKIFGTAWTGKEKADRLGIHVDALYKRLERARLRLLGVLPLFVGVDRQSEVK